MASPSVCLLGCRDAVQHRRRLGYVSLFSMLIGFVFWYRGLAQSGVASVGQLQLLQPFFGFALAAILLREPATPTMLLVSVGVIGCVAGARRFAQPSRAAGLPRSAE